MNLSRNKKANRLSMKTNTMKTSILWKSAALATVAALAVFAAGCGKEETHSEHDGHDHGKTNAPAQDAHKGHNHGPGEQH